MKKNSFFTFIFAFWPGAGQMYLGLMKRGTSIMTAFFLIICIAGFFDLGIICLALPVLWFYSFFDTLNYNNMPYERKILIEDKFLFVDEIFGDKSGAIGSKKNSLVGGILIFIGIYAIFSNFVRPFLWRMSDMMNSSIIYDFICNIPTLALIIFIILFGIKLTKGKTEDEIDMRTEIDKMCERHKDDIQ